MKIEKLCREPISTLTHFIGFLFAIPCAVLLTYEASKYATVWHVVSLSIFGSALMLLYAASSLYHMLPVSKKIVNIFRKIDHMMIFVLIAGTYTPVCLVSLKGVWGWTLLSAVWGFAIIGIVLKACCINALKHISTALYVIMGWLVIAAFYPLSKAVPIGGILLLLAGGIIYTLGAVIYSMEKSDTIIRKFGFHEVFHIFVMGGSFFHILFMFEYIL